MESWHIKNRICIIFCILTGFSRNYLGVHTPQDVVVGFMVGSLVLWGMYKLVNYLSVHPEKENYFLLAGVLLGIFGLIYVNYKPYPMDYVDGKLLVDPQKMLNDAYLDLGGLSIFCITRFIEKKWIGFKSTGLSLKGILVSLAGLVCLVLLMKLTMNWFISHLGFKLGSLAIKSVLLLFAIDIYPLCIKYIMKQS